MNNLRRLIRQKESLHKKLHHLEIQKRKLRTHHISLQEKLKNKKISSIEFHKLLNEILKGRSYEQWMIYFDEYHNYYKKHLKICETKIEKEKAKNKNKKIILGSIAVIFLIFTSILFISNPQLTGLAVGNITNETITKINVEETINETLQKNITIEKNISAKELMTTSNKTDGGNATIPIEKNMTKKIIPKINITIPVKKEPITNPKENITKILPNKTSIGDDKITTTKSRIVINRPVKWIQKISLNKSKNETFILPKSAENISILTAGKIQESLNELTAFNEIINKSTKEEIKAGILTGKITIEVQKKKGIITRFWEWLTRFTITGQVITEIKTKEIIIETANEKIIDLTNITESEIAIEFYTEAPTSVETLTERGKKIIISTKNELGYENVLAYAEINKRVKNNSIFIYNLANNTKTLVNFESFDLDSDGFVDYIEWNVPHLSEQVYELILITKADHLDKNKIIISDIYDEVNILDGIWSPTISNEEYVRVVFEKKLDDTKDITVFPKIISGTPKIEIYEIGGNEIIATFETLNDSDYNKVFLTKLNGSQDSFELKILNGSVQFDLIFDPTCTGILNCSAYSNETGCSANSQCNWDPAASDTKIGTWVDSLGTFDATPTLNTWTGIPFNSQISTNAIYNQNANDITVQASQSGHYLALYTIALTSDYNNRLGWEARIAVNNVGIDGTYSSCSKIGNINATTANYSCIIDMWYFDGAGDWTIKVSINDTEDYIEDLSTTFLLGETTAMVFSPNSLTFSGATSPLDIDIFADQTIKINNTGNGEIPPGNLQITATNLIGETDSSLAIYAENFTAYTSQVCNVGIQMQNATGTTLITAILPKGNFSLNNGNAQEELFYCLEAINQDLTAQTYSTSKGGAWTITLLLTALRITTPRKKKSKKKREEKRNTQNCKKQELERNLLLENPEFLEFLERKNAFEEFKKELVKETKIPVTIFKSRNALEAICRYLKDEREMKLSEIARTLNRNPRTIWTSYHNADAEIFTSEKTNITIPVSIFEKKNLSILESLSIYLKNSGMKNREIATLIGKNTKTIWTFISRAEKKLK